MDKVKFVKDYSHGEISVLLRPHPEDEQDRNIIYNIEKNGKVILGVTRDVKGKEHKIEIKAKDLVDQGVCIFL